MVIWYIMCTCYNRLPKSWPYEFLSEWSQLFRRKSSKASHEVVRGWLALLEGLPDVFCFKNGEWRESHLGFSVTFASHRIQWFHSDKNNRVCVFCTYKEQINFYLLSAEVVTNKDFRYKLTTSGGWKKPKLVLISSRYSWKEISSDGFLTNILCCNLNCANKNETLVRKKWGKASNHWGRPLQNRKEWLTQWNGKRTL